MKMMRGRIALCASVVLALSGACGGVNEPPGGVGSGDGVGGAVSGGTGGSSETGGASGTGETGGSGGDENTGSGGSAITAGAGGAAGRGGAGGAVKPADGGTVETGGSSGAGGRDAATARTDAGMARSDAATVRTDAGMARSDAATARTDAATVKTDAASLPCDLTWPVPTSTQQVPASIAVSGTYDGAMKRFVGTGALGSATQSEGQDPLFVLADGAVLKNVILGNPAADGVHCNGSCTLQNVWWEDVGEDAATLKGKSASQVMTIDGGGAMHASDKVFQHNGPGTMIVKNFYVEDFGKLYRSCGNCSTQYARHAVFQNVTLVVRGSSIAGINSNYMDTARFQQITICDPARAMTICQRYTGNSTGDEPVSIGKGADGTSCIYEPSDITWLSP